MHIPVVIIRVVRWETVQTWCLISTLFTVVVTAQAYSSTRFQADKILTWTPLMLVIDAGSMAQVLFLVNEGHDILSRLWRELADLKKQGWKPLSEKLLRLGRGSCIPSPSQNEHVGDRIQSDIEKPAPEHNENSELSLPAPAPIHHKQVPVLGVPANSLCSEFRSSSTGPLQAETRLQADRKPTLLKSRSFYNFLSALILLVAVFVLQVLGLTRALHHARRPTPPVSWCSPVFAPFGLAVLDGNCSIFPIVQTFSKGVGCVLIPGTQQKSWLRTTVAGTSISLALEVLDITVLSLVSSSTRWRGVKMRRPWFTMFSGIAVLGLLLVFGVVYSTTRPPGIGQRIWVVIDAGTPTVWQGELRTAGLRGAMIGWNDGVFEGWGSTYFGSWVD